MSVSVPKIIFFFKYKDPLRGGLFRVTDARVRLLSKEEAQATLAS